MTYQVIECYMPEETTEVFDDGLSFEDATALAKMLNEGNEDFKYFVIPRFVDIYD